MIINKWQKENYFNKKNCNPHVLLNNLISRKSNI